MTTMLSVFMAILLQVFAYAADVSVVESSSVTNAEKSGQVGLGLAVGSLIGLSAQYWVDNDHALNATFATEHGNAALSAAHLWLFRGAFGDSSREATSFLPYIGAGAIAAFGTQSDYFTRNNRNTAIAAQLPLGIEFLPILQRFDIFAEVAPSLEITPTVVGFLTALVGARFYF